MGIAERLNSLPKLVFSNTLREAPWGKWEPARVVPDSSSYIRWTRVNARTYDTGVVFLAYEPQ